MQMSSVEESLGQLKGGLRMWGKYITSCRDGGISEADVQHMLTTYQLACSSFADLEVSLVPLE